MYDISLSSNNGIQFPSSLLFIGFSHNLSYRKQTNH
jgi:hypothetical protein